MLALQKHSESFRSREGDSPSYGDGYSEPGSVQMLWRCTGAEQETGLDRVSDGVP